MFFINNDNSNSINKLNNGGSCAFRINWNIKPISIIQIIHSQSDLRFNEFECYGQHNEKKIK